MTHRVAFYDLGLLYTTAAGLLNAVAVADALGVADDRRAERAAFLAGAAAERAASAARGPRRRGGAGPRARGRARGDRGRADDRLGRGRAGGARVADAAVSRERAGRGATAVRLVDVVLLLPLLAAIAVAMGAIGRREPGDVARASVQSFATLIGVLAGVSIVVRLLSAFFV